MMDWISPEMKRIGNSAVLQMTVFVVLSKRRSGIGVILWVLSSCLEANVESMKQCVEPESTSVTVRVLPEFPLLVPFIVLLPLSVSALAY